MTSSKVFAAEVPPKANTLLDPALRWWDYRTSAGIYVNPPVLLCGGKWMSKAEVGMCFHAEDGVAGHSHDLPNHVVLVFKVSLTTFHARADVFSSKQFDRHGRVMVSGPTGGGLCRDGVERGAKDHGVT